jgi:ATP-dependent exoDNAse (exonuclease V) beta subunit
MSAMSSLPKKSSLFEFPEVRVVEASAGSGKTYALAKRYVQLVLLAAAQNDPEPLRSILAISFTNKTANEMKARILLFLKKLALDKFKPDEDPDEILRPIGLSRERAGELAKRAMAAVISHYNYFQAQTIDKFVNSLIVGSAFDIGLTADFRIKTRSNAFYERAFDELLEEAAHDQHTRVMFERFLDAYLYIENRLAWMPRQEILKVLATFFRVYNTYGKEFVGTSGLYDHMIDQRKKVLKAALDFQDTAGGFINPHKGWKYAEKLKEFVGRSGLDFDFDRIPKLFEKTDTIFKGEPTQAAEKSFEKVRREIGKLIDLESDWAFMPYLPFFKAVREKLEGICRKEDVLFLEELNRKAKLVFKDGVTANELYIRLAARFRHHLIDEFQDTSRLQWSNLEVLIADALSSDGSLFYVGDKKQNIFSFRGGDPALFEEVKASFPIDHIVTERLELNRRSCHEIVTFNNEVFSEKNLERFLFAVGHDEAGKEKAGTVTLERDDLKLFMDVYAGAEQGHLKKKTGGHVRLEALDIKDGDLSDEEIRRRTIERLQELHSRFSWRDIALLVRWHRDAEEATRWLIEADIPVDSERASSIKDHPHIQEIVAFLRFLNSPLDNAAFAEFIQGEVFLGASGLAAEKVRDLLLSFRERPREERRMNLYLAFRQAFPESWEKFIDEFFRNIGLYPLYELVVSLYNRLDCLRRFPGSQAFFMRFLELIREREEEYYDAGTFLEDYEALKGEDVYVTVASRDAVRVTTFHKAKGLDFPVVIIPFLAMKVEVGKNDDNGINFTLIPEGDGLKLCRIKKDYGNIHAGMARLYKEEWKRELLNELNAFYVAMTRAIFELHAFIPLKAGRSNNLIQALVPENKMLCGAPGVYDHSRKDERAETPLPPASCCDWISFLKDEFTDVRSLAARSEAERGELFHAILAGISSVKPGEEAAAVQPAVAAVERVNRRPCPAEVVAKITDLLRTQDIQRFFDHSLQDARTEVEFVDRYGNTRRVDRLLVTEKEIRVVDFKSRRGAEEEAREQVREYLEILKEVQPGKIVSGFVVYIEEKEVEEVTGR